MSIKRWMLRQDMPVLLRIANLVAAAQRYRHEIGPKAPELLIMIFDGLSTVISSCDVAVMEM